MTATRIIIVEDERIVALHMRQQLAKLGYVVVAVATTSEEALRKIIELRPDVILMDVHIEGGIDGIETIARIPTGINAAVIYVTAYSEEATLLRASETKPHGYLIKPYADRELHATIQMALERRQADSALRASEDRIRSIFNEVSEGIFLLDALTGTFIDANEPGCSMFGYTVDELLGKDVESLSSGVPPYTQSGAREWIEKAAATGESQRVRWQCKTSNGRVFPAEISMRFASIAERSVVLSIVRDLTEQEAIEAQLRQSQKMEVLGHLTGGMAHDFNNLLGIIIGNLDMVRSLPSAANDANIGQLTGEALDAALRGAELTKRLLAFARRQPLRPQHIDVNDLIQGISKLLSRTLGEDLEIKLNLEPKLWPVHADPSQLEASLINIVNNARDAMPRGGLVTITTTNSTLDEDYAATQADLAPGDYAMIEVSDTGTGIPPDLVDKIFDPFFTTKEQGKGTGLGLSMVFGFAKQSAGHINVYSELGQGTTFRLYLPRSKTAISKERKPETAVRGGHETILVVEDNDNLRRVVVRQLKGLGYAVLEAENGAAALRVLQYERVDLLFTDIMMPGGMNGYDLAQNALVGQPTLKVLLTSGFPDTKLDNNRGASAKLQLLTKPYRKDDLSRAIRQLFDTE